MNPLITFNFMEGSNNLQFFEIACQILWRIPESQALIFHVWRSSVWGQLQEFCCSRVDGSGNRKKTKAYRSTGGLGYLYISRRTSVSACVELWYSCKSCT